MSVNTSFYGDTLGLMIKTSYTNSNIYLANFSGVSSPTESAAHLVTGVDAGRFAFGTPLDDSIQTHGVAKNDDTYNTLLHYGGFDVLGSSSNTVTPSGNVGSVPVLWGYHLRNPSSSVTDYPQAYTTGYTGRLIERPDVLWKSGGEKSLDAFSMNPVVKMDFKNIIVVPLVFASTDTYNSTPDEYGRYTLNESSFASMYCYTLNRYINTDFIIRPTVHGIGYMSFLCDIDANGNISFDNIRNFIPYSMQAVPNLTYNFSACEKIGSTILPAAGNVLAVGNDYTSPVIPGNGLVINYTTTAGSAYTVSPSSGNIPFILGTTVRVDGTRQLADITYGDRYKGCTVCAGRNHVAIIKSSSNQWVQRPVWFDAPQDPQMFRDTVHKMMSYLGVMWADEIGGIETGDTPVYIGVIDDNGLTTGVFQRVTTPDDIKQLASDDWINDNTYDPASIDPNTYTDTMPTGQAPPVQSCNRYYALNKTNIGRLYEGLLNTLSSVPTGEMEDYLLSHFATSSPIDLLNSLKWLPFDFVRFFDTSGEHTIFIGGLPLHDNDGNAVTGYRAREATEFSITKHIGNFNLFRHFGDFRDFEPYTGVDVYIPFCTPISVKPSMCMGHDIAVQISIDIITGNITGRLRLDSTMGIIIGTTSGNCAIDLPISGVDTATYNNAMYQAVQNAKSADRGLAAAYIGAVTGGASSITGAFDAVDKKHPTPPAGMAVGAADTAVNSTFATVNAWQNKINADYQLSHVPVPYHNISAVNSALAMLQPLHTYVIISRPVMLPGYNDKYGHTTGYATIYNGTLDNLSGLTVCASADLSGIPATAEEKEMISAALKSGVYL